MNQIIKKCNPKRKYKRHPKCANLDGLCDWNFCRCDYPLKAPKSTQKIDEYLHHRQKAVKRRREVELMKLDNELNEAIDYHLSQKIRGLRPRKSYAKTIWLVVGIIVAIPLVYMLLIAIYDYTIVC